MNSRYTKSMLQLVAGLAICVLSAHLFLESKPLIAGLGIVVGFLMAFRIMNRVVQHLDK